MGSIRKHKKRASRTDNVLFTGGFGVPSEKCPSHVFSGKPYDFWNSQYGVNSVFMIEMAQWFSYPSTFWIEDESDGFRETSTL